MWQKVCCIVGGKQWLVSKGYICSKLPCSKVWTDVSVNKCICHVPLTIGEISCLSVFLYQELKLNIRCSAEFSSQGRAG